MTARQRIIRERRQYNQWVASQTLEDYALRYTASQARKSSFRVGNTAFGPIAFLACEAIGGAITLSYGFNNAAGAIISFCALMFLIGVPICVYAARYGVDIDLLTRGAGFGYIGSTITSLIYASFTFLLFAIEASIMSTALRLLFDIPLWIGHLVSALVVIPIALYGISLISRFQMLTQPLWLVLQILPLAYIAWKNPGDVAEWTRYAGEQGSGSGLDWPLFAAASGVLLSLLPQIGEQVDYLRFLPERRAGNRIGWWVAVLGTGPGWVVMGGLKLLAGSFLAWMLLQSGLVRSQADDPTTMYHHVFGTVFDSPTTALLVTGLFVIVCQVKINVTNAYAGSIAWSNFFSRVTHSHPGRVVWLVFNVLLALLLMEVGIFQAIESVLALYANFAAGWIGAITADLVVNKPLGLSPRGIEFKRAHLYDINPVGVGALGAAVVISSLAHLGLLGEAARVLSPFIALATAMLVAPLIAWWTKGRYYLARNPDPARTANTCTVCENRFETADMALCPAYGGSICSLCCSLDARCRDQCKPSARASDQLEAFLRKLLPGPVAGLADTQGGRFAGLMLLSNLLVALVLAFIYAYVGGPDEAARAATRATLWMVYFSFLLLSAVAVWVIVLAVENRRVAESESARQTSMLMDEIAAHNRTDAALQKAKEVAESANLAKSRYIIGLSHEIRTPLNSIYGYAQLMERSPSEPPPNAVKVIRRSAEHLSSLIDGLLDISRIEGGVLQLNRDRLRLGEFLDQLEDMFRLQATSKGIGFLCDRPPHLPAVVYTDEKRLRQILINLLSNAVKYTTEGHAALVVRYRNQVAEFEVSDTGMGIAPEDRERVFGPFERGSAAEVRAIPGTGLGLTITKLLTEVMGGEIILSTAPRQGTTFTVRLLLSEAMQHAGSELSRHIRGYAGPRMRILVVDDDPMHVQFMASLLRPLGFEVEAIHAGAGAVAAVARFSPDLLLLDLSLPDMTGWDVARQLREGAAPPAMRIVVVSANAHEYAPGSGEALHDAFVMKPVDATVLLEALREQLGLEWIYGSEPAALEAGLAVSAELRERVAQHLEDLWQLGLIGHVRGIQARLREFEAVEPTAVPLAQALRAMVERFDMRRYMTTIKELRDGTNASEGQQGIRGSA
jgi:signal transduction histidine kinase/DNA-binding NarL/FixJ family response regulator/purine-cytosine permease-like protein